MRGYSTHAELTHMFGERTKPYWESAPKALYTKQSRGNKGEMMKSRRGDISLNMIIIAAIALIVLVVIVAIFTGRMGDFGRRLTGEQNKYCGTIPTAEKATATTVNGIVREEGPGCGEGKREIYGSFKDVNFGQVCCQQ